jgi:hypothetical protein
MREAHRTCGACRTKPAPRAGSPPRREWGLPQQRGRQTREPNPLRRCRWALSCGASSRKSICLHARVAASTVRPLLVAVPVGSRRRSALAGRVEGGLGSSLTQVLRRGNSLAAAGGYRRRADGQNQNGLRGVGRHAAAFIGGAALGFSRLRVFSQPHDGPFSPQPRARVFLAS